PLTRSLSTIPRPPPSTLFPYTTLFRSRQHQRLASNPHDETGKLLILKRRETIKWRGQEMRRIERLWHRGDDCPEQAHLKGDNQQDRKSTRLNSSHVKISYAVFCLKKKI